MCCESILCFVFVVHVTQSFEFWCLWFCGVCVVFVCAAAEQVHNLCFSGKQTIDLYGIRSVDCKGTIQEIKVLEQPSANLLLCAVVYWTGIQELQQWTSLAC